LQICDYRKGLPPPKEAIASLPPRPENSEHGACLQGWKKPRFFDFFKGFLGF